jgi:hypothetical protein
LNSPSSFWTKNYVDTVSQTNFDIYHQAFGDVFVAVAITVVVVAAVAVAFVVVVQVGLTLGDPLLELVPLGVASLQRGQRVFLGLVEPSQRHQSRGSEDIFQFHLLYPYLKNVNKKYNVV